MKVQRGTTTNITAQLLVLQQMKRFYYLSTLLLVLITAYLRYFNSHLFITNHHYAFAAIFVILFLRTLHCLTSFYFFRFVYRHVYAGKLFWIFFYVLEGTVFIQSYSNIRGVLRSTLFRIFISIPSSWHQVVLIMFSLVLMCVSLFEIVSTLSLVKFKQFCLFLAMCLSTIGVYHTIVPLHYSTHGLQSISLPITNSHGKSFTFAHLSDIHLGHAMSVETMQSLSHYIAQTVKPDFVFLTGDYYTMESQAEPFALSESMKPLQQYKDKMFANLGNHDLEIEEQVLQRELETSHIKLLQNEIIFLKNWNIQILGLDYIQFQTKEKLTAIYHQQIANTEQQKPWLRIILLHNPNHFTYLPDKSNDENVVELVLSGHLHAGQFALTSFGIPNYSVVSWFLNFPDVGWWCKMNHDDTVHRLLHINHWTQLCKNQRILLVSGGTGFYGLPLRVGTQNDHNSFVKVIAK